MIERRSPVGGRGRRQDPVGLGDTTRLAVDIIMEDEAWTAVFGLDEAISSAAEQAYARANVRLANQITADRASVAVALLSDAGMRVLNSQFRHQDKPTNVLSFPAIEHRHAGAGRGVEDPRALGDVALAYETIDREARQEGIAVVDHVRHLVVHGILHLLGFDHESDTDADRMEAMETRILAELGVADPYAR